MKTLLITILLLTSLVSNAQWAKKRTPTKMDTVILIIPHDGGSFVNNKTTFIAGYSCMFLAGAFRVAHKIYLLEPHYFEKWGWNPEPRTNQGNTSNGFNSVLSPFKNEDHFVESLATGLTWTGGALIAYNFVDGFKFTKNSVWKNVLQIGGHLVLSRVSMAAGGQVANYIIKGQFDHL